MGKPVLRTRLCDMLNIEYPILSAGMGPSLIGEKNRSAGGIGGGGVRSRWIRGVGGFPPFPWRRCAKLSVKSRNSRTSLSA